MKMWTRVESIKVGNVANNVFPSPVGSITTNGVSRFSIANVA